MIDSHCHLTSSQLAHRVEEVIDSARVAGVHTLISIATDGADALAARQIAEHHENVYFSSGIHPPIKANFHEGFLDKLRNPRFLIALSSIYWDNVLRGI